MEIPLNERGANDGAACKWEMRLMIRLHVSLIPVHCVGRHICQNLVSCSNYPVQCTRRN